MQLLSIIVILSALDIAFQASSSTELVIDVMNKWWQP